MLQIYCGNGKGKTTAAVGLAVRAAGAGLRVAFYQFLKDGSSSEIVVLRTVPGVTVRCCTSCTKFTFSMNDAEKAAVRAEQDSMLSEAEELLRTGTVDIVVLDELVGAYRSGLLDTAAADSLTELQTDTELVITGREPSPAMFAAADYISEIAEVRHPYTNGVTARRGIEY